jgi:hypothetical protein
MPAAPPGIVAFGSLTPSELPDPEQLATAIEDPSKKMSRMRTKFMCARFRDDWQYMSGRYRGSSYR